MSSPTQALLTTRSAQRDDSAVLAAEGLLRRFFGTLDSDAVAPVCGEQARELTVHRLPHPVPVGAGRSLWAHGHWRALHDMELLQSQDVLELKRERRYRDLPAALCGKREHVGRGAVDTDRWQGRRRGRDRAAAECCRLNRHGGWAAPGTLVRLHSSCSNAPSCSGSAHSALLSEPDTRLPIYLVYLFGGGGADGGVGGRPPGPHP
jgi:hypothetical protein